MLYATGGEGGSGDDGGGAGGAGGVGGIGGGRCTAYMYEIRSGCELVAPPMYSV